MVCSTPPTVTLAPTSAMAILMPLIIEVVWALALPVRGRLLTMVSDSADQDAVASESDSTAAARAVRIIGRISWAGAAQGRQRGHVARRNHCCGNDYRRKRGDGPRATGYRFLYGRSSLGISDLVFCGR